MSTLEDIIDSPEYLEVKRALAVKIFIFDFKTSPVKVGNLESIS